MRVCKHAFCRRNFDCLPSKIGNFKFLIFAFQNLVYWLWCCFYSNGPFSKFRIQKFSADTKFSFDAIKFPSGLKFLL
jgi:hypothetical protein